MIPTCSLDAWLGEHGAHTRRRVEAVDETGPAVIFLLCLTCGVFFAVDEVSAAPEASGLS